VGVFFLRNHRKDGDAGWIVIDEAAGTLLATTGVGGWPTVLAFVVFRVADITKNPFPGVSQAEGLSEGWGVMADDLVAALYGLAAGHLLLALI
jgi:phosphatidylglycerophosphatase A